MEQLKKLEVGQKYTIASYGAFGFAYSIQFELVEVQAKPWAQYRETVVLVFKQKGKRKLRQLRFYDYSRFIVWAGYVEPNVSMWATEGERENGVTFKRSFESFSNEYLERALASVKQEPLFTKLDREKKEVA